MGNKRGADTELIKTSGGEVVSKPQKLGVGEGNADGLPKMATAAQMAARKVAAPKRRLPTTTTSFTGSPMPNYAPVQSNGFQVPQSSSFTFGQNTTPMPQFPAAPFAPAEEEAKDPERAKRSRTFGSFAQPAANTTANTTSIFSPENGFPAIQQPSSFTFGQPVTNNEQRSNSPFPQTNGFQAPSSNSFTFGQPVATTEQPSSSLFPQANGLQTPGKSSSFTFGQPATNTTQPSNSFFAQGNGFKAPQANPFSFGQPSTNTEQRPESPFPQTNGFRPSQPNPFAAFGQANTNTEQRAESPFPPANGSQALQSNLFASGQSARNEASASSGVFSDASQLQVPQAPNHFTFGATNNQQAPNPLFGSANALRPQPETNQLAFGTPVASNPPTIASVFGQGNSFQPAQPSAPFGLGSSEVAPTQQVYIPQASFFYDTPVAVSEPIPDAVMITPPEPEADLSVQNPVPQAPATPASEAPAMAESIPAVHAPPTPVSDSSDHVEPSTPTTVNTPAVEKTTTSAVPQVNSALASGLEHSNIPRAPATCTSICTPVPFTFAAPVSTHAQVTMDTPVVREPTSVAPEPTMAANAVAQVSATPSVPETTTTTPTPTTTAIPSVQSWASAVPTPAATNDTNPDTRVRLLTQGPLEIPDDMGAQEFLGFSKYSRLHGLGRELQHRIALVDPASQDFDNLLLHYYAVREKMGFPMKVSLVAATKRKADNVDVEDDQPNHAKRARRDSAASPPVPSVATSTSNAFSTLISTPSPVTEQNANGNANANANASPPRQASDHALGSASPRKSEQPQVTFTAATPQPAANPFQPTNVFSQTPKNIFDSVRAGAPEQPESNSTPSTSQPASNPFLSINKSSQAPQAPQNLFGSTTAGTSEPPKFSFTASTPQPSSNPLPSIKPSAASAPAKVAAPVESHPPSATPVESPKKPAFEVPKFGGGGPVNFMASFAKQSEASVAKLADEAKTKRKLEEFDSDDDDEAEWERKYEEEARAKRNKLEEIAKSARLPAFNQLSTPPATQEPSNGPTRPFNVTGATTVDDRRERSATSSSFNSLFNSPPVEEQPKPDDKKSDHEGVDDADAVDDDEADEDYEGEDVSEDEYEQDDEDDEEDENEDGDNGDSEGEEDGDHEDIEAEAGDDHHPDDVEHEEAPVNTEDKHDSEDNNTAVASAQSSTKPKSLADRITYPDGPPSTVTPAPNGGLGTSFLKKKAAPNNSFTPFTPPVEENKPTPEAPTFSPITPFTGFAAPKPAAPRATFQFTPTPMTKEEPVVGKTSVLNGGFINTTGPIPGEGLFGSRPSTPQPELKAATPAANTTGKTSSIFGHKTDQTWKAGSAITFGTPQAFGTPSTALGTSSTAFGAPSFNFMPATPSAKDSKDTKASKPPFSGLFGGDGPAITKPPVPEQPSVGFTFGEPVKPAPGFLGAASHLLPVGNIGSAGSSRATSPGLTDTESVGTNDSEDLTNDPQTSLIDARPGEENEDILFEVRSKALKFFDREAASKTKMTPDTFNSIGLGILRVLKNKDSGKTRIVFRAEPGANIIINSNLIPSMNYTPGGNTKSGQIRFGIANADGRVDKYILKVKTDSIAHELAAVLNSNK